MPRSDDGRWLANCERCGTPYQQNRPAQRFCSKSCGTSGDKPGKAGPRVAGVELTCQNPACARTFLAKRSDKRACSRACYDQLPDVRKRTLDYLAQPNVVARKNNQRAERRSDPQFIAQIRSANLRANLRRYGLTVEDYDRMVLDQDGRCMICRQPPDPDGVRAASRLHADHDHVTHRNRDLLCLSCNVGIGHFRDDPALLRAAAEYIERHRLAA